jgi:hypothetical protein
LSYRGGNGGVIGIIIIVNGLAFAQGVARFSHEKRTEQIGGMSLIGCSG